MNSAAFSSDGYLIDQSRLSGVPFGWFSSARNGCGWIACYNACRLLDDPRPAVEIRARLEKGLPLGGAFGTNLFQLVWYFLREGHAVRLSVLPPCAERLARRAPASILLYWHRKGAHFVALSPKGERLRFFNATYGSACDLAGLAEFLRTRAAVPLGVLLVIDDPVRLRRGRAATARKLLDFQKVYPFNP